MTTKAKIYISWVAAAGLIVLAAGLYRWQSSGLPRLLAFLFLAMVLSTQKIRLPGMKGTMSLSFPFILVGIADFGFGETLLLGCTAAFVQTLWHAKTPPKPEQIVFNIATLVLSAGFADWFSHTVLRLLHLNSLVLLLAAASLIYLLLNTGLVAGVISLTEEKAFQKEWLYCFYWAFPYFLVSAVAAGVVSALSQFGSWLAALLVLPLIFLCHLWYQIHVERTVRVSAAVPSSDEFPAVLVHDSE